MSGTWGLEAAEAGVGGLDIFAVKKKSRNRQKAEPRLYCYVEREEEVLVLGTITKA